MLHNFDIIWHHFNKYAILRIIWYLFLLIAIYTSSHNYPNFNNCHLSYLTTFTFKCSLLFLFTIMNIHVVIFTFIWSYTNFLFLKYIYPYLSIKKQTTSTQKGLEQIKWLQFWYNMYLLMKFFLKFLNDHVLIFNLDMKLIYLLLKL